MGKVKFVQIALDGNVDVFSQGDVIRGEVVMETGEDVKRVLKDVKGVWVRFRGKAKTEVTPGNDDSPRVEKEKYFDASLVLFGTGEHQPDIDGLNLAAGRHVFPFEFPLPHEPPLPAPFEGEQGRVRYKIKATVALIGIFSLKKYLAERQFKVVGPVVDLNNVPSVQVPINESFQILSCCGCGSAIDTVVSVSLPRRGYIPGESIYLTGHVDNRDGDETYEIKAKLVQRVIFTSKGHTKVKKQLLCRAFTSVPCARGQVTNFTVGQLPVPAGPPSGLPGCSLINVEYYVECSGPSLQTNFPVIIGTVPVRIASPTAPPVIPTAQPPDGLDLATAGGYNTNEPPPPSYEEVMGVMNPQGHSSEIQLPPVSPDFDLRMYSEQ